jgi:multiple antibiotic resistance protein
MFDQIFSISFTLFLLMDSFGNIPIYLIILKEFGEKKRRLILLRELLIALFTIYLFAFLGEGFLRVLEISKESIFLAGAIVLFLMAVKMIFPEKGSMAHTFAGEGEPLIFPLAVPLIAGPSTLAAVMIYALQVSSMWMLYLSIFMAWIASSLVLYLSTYLQRWLGDRGLKALERLMGLVLILLAINMFLNGLRIFHKSL